MKINGIQCEVYDPELLAHNIDYTAFDYDERYYRNEENVKVAMEYRYSERNFIYRKELAALHQIPSRG